MRGNWIEIEIEIGKVDQMMSGEGLGSDAHHCSKERWMRVVYSVSFLYYFGELRGSVCK